MDNDSMTTSLCPVCLSLLPARRRIDGENAFLEKTCPEHGEFRVPIWRGRPPFESWRRPKIPTRPPVVYKQAEHGCPFDCGLCSEHRQRTCTVIVEVTERCNLDCVFCYADSGSKAAPDPDAAVVVHRLERARQTAGDCNLQFSGGEPTLRDDLPELVEAAHRAGFSFVQINTNGVRLAREQEFVRRLKDAGLNSVFLQFDATDDGVYRRMRGRPLYGEKCRAVETCGKEGIGVVLVPTLVPGINTEEVGKILDRALEWAPVVRNVHFQPVSYFGRHPGPPPDEQRLTLPELMQLIEAQTEGRFRVEHFRPPGCENALCSFHANYVVLPGGKVHPLSSKKQDKCCGGGEEKAEEGALRTIRFVARQWQAPRIDPASLKVVTPAQPASPAALPRLEDFIARARSHTLSVSAMAFQDVWNLDLERVKDCCIHVAAPDGRLIPFCLYNLTAAEGRNLYRS